MSGASLSVRRDFRLLLFGQTTSQFGAQISGVALPMLAVLTLHASPLQLGLVNAASTAAFAVLGLPAGAWLEGRALRPVLISSDGVRALLLAAVPVVAWWGGLGIGELIAVALATGAARVFFDLGYQSYVPALLGPGQVLSGNATMETARAAGQFAGPGLGGWLVGWIGAADVIGVQAATFAVSALCLLAIRSREAATPAVPGGPGPARRIRAGLAHVAGDPVLRALALTSGLSNFAFALSSSVGILFLTRTLDLGPSLVGLVVAAGSVAAMAGAAMTPWLSRRLGGERVVWLALAATGPVTLLVPAARPGWGIALAVAGGVVGELGQIVYAITSLSLRQRRCDPSVLGRVNATMRFVILGLTPLGAVVGGAVAEAVGVRATLLTAQSVVVAATVPVWRALRKPRAAAEAGPAPAG